MIPKILHRVVPVVTTPLVEDYWREFRAMHPTWLLQTWRDPIDPSEFPILGHLFPACRTGAGLADLIRLEVLWHQGGVYVDSDCEPVRPLDPLLSHGFFIGQEQLGVCTNAVMGAEPEHPATRAYMDEVLRATPEAFRVERPDVVSGPVAASKALWLRPDVELLPPATFYPEPWVATLEEKRAPAGDIASASPETYLIHRWAGSWLPPLTPYRRLRRVARRYLRRPPTSGLPEVTSVNQ